MRKGVFRFWLFGLLLALIAQPFSVPARGEASPPGTRAIIRLADLPLALYEGGIGDYTPTAPQVAGQRRLDVDAPASRAYLDYLQERQTAFCAALEKTLPGAKVEYRFRILLNGLAISLPQPDRRTWETLRRLPGVIGVYPERAYRLALDQSVPLIGAPALWEVLGGVEHAGEGVKIAISDTGIYTSNPFFSPTTFQYPPGFPKGDARYTTPKVIVARAYFRPHDPPAPGEPPTPIDNHGHGTHVAGIAAGVAGTSTPMGPLSGVAPRAWLMNYKIFYYARSGGDPVAYTPEIVASMEDAVADGADVYNGSWGGTADFAPEADPMVLAAEAMVRAGVVAVFAAGNDGANTATINSPAIGPNVIAAGATTTGRWGRRPDDLWSGSSRGPAIGLALKPDLVAPGFGIYSSLRSYFGTLAGTSMAAPHVAGAAALLRQSHPDWSPAQIKAALMNTAEVEIHEGSGAARITGQGAGRIALAQAHDPGFLLSPPGLSFGQARAGAVISRTITAQNVGASGIYSVTVESLSDTPGVTVTASISRWLASGIGEFAVYLEADSTAVPGEREGRIWLAQGERRLHVPWWVRVLPAGQSADILLLDDDASSLNGGRDYLPYYVRLLEDRGLTYTVWDVGVKWQQSMGRERGALPDAAYLQGFAAVIWFAGDSTRTYSGIGARVGDRLAMLDYLQCGGRLLVTGQTFSGYYLGNGEDDAHLLDIGLGADVIGEDTWAPAIYPSPLIAVEAVHTAPAFAGMRFDLGTSQEVKERVHLPLVLKHFSRPGVAAGGAWASGGGAGAGNAVGVDELAPIPEYDGQVILRALLPGAERDGAVGIAKSSDPTLENPIPAMPPGRSVYLSFGLESINDHTGHTTRRALLERVLAWLADDLRVTITGGEAANPYDLVALTAIMTSNIPDDDSLRYRWDLGDGSPIVETELPSIAYAYKRPGVYHPRVEVMDRLGHTAVSAPGTVLVHSGSTPTLSCIAHRRALESVR